MNERQIHITKQSDDEEDLESLRLAALKSLHIKKESSYSGESNSGETFQKRAPITVSGPSTPSTAHFIYNTTSQSNPAPYIRGNHVDSKTHPYYPPQYYNTTKHSNPSIVLGGSLPPNCPNRHMNTVPLENYGKRLLPTDKLERNDSFMAQQMPSHTVNPINTVPPVQSSWNYPDTNPALNNGFIAMYNSTKMTDPTVLSTQSNLSTSVQLSPRSRAFVTENNCILMRRKGGGGESISPVHRRLSSSKSPIYNREPPYRSPSPLYRDLASRWSRSPSFQAKSRSRSPAARHTRPANYSFQRSSSRTPPPLLSSRTKSPFSHRRRSSSRSPLPQQSSSSLPQRVQRHQQLSPPRRFSSKSPRSSPIRKRFKSRSPLPSVSQLKYRGSPRRSRSPQSHLKHSRPHSKSPIGGNRRRSPLPTNRYNKGGGRQTPPMPQHRKPSPSNEVNGSLRPSNRRRSPGNNMFNNNNGKSRSRSPQRKFLRRSRERNVNVNSHINRKRSPFPKRRDDGYRNRNRKRSPSPTHMRKRSRSKSPSLKKRREENKPRGGNVDHQRRKEYNSREFSNRYDRNDIDDKNPENKQQKYSTTPPRMTNNEEYPNKVTMSSEKLIECKKENKIENIKSGNDILTNKSGKDEVKGHEETQKEEKSNEEKDNVSSSDDENDDGIDLFPSDESESENEGRFKLSSRTERDRNVPIPSFTKLAESSIPDVVKDLKLVETNKRETGSAKRADKPLRSNRSYGGRHREEKFRKTDNGKSSRSERNRGTDSRSAPSRKDRDVKFPEDQKDKRERPGVKFHNVEIETLKPNSRSSLDKSDLNDRKLSPYSKKKSYNKDDSEIETGNERLTSTSGSSLAKNSKSSSNGGNSVSDHRNSNSSISPRSGNNNSTCSSGININVGTTKSEQGDEGGSEGNSKKPIHLRLGAMTNTFKAPKKSSNWSATATDKV